MAQDQLVSSRSSDERLQGSLLAPGRLGPRVPGFALEKRVFPAPLPRSSLVLCRCLFFRIWSTRNPCQSSTLPHAYPVPPRLFGGV